MHTSRIYRIEVINNLHTPLPSTFLTLPLTLATKKIHTNKKQQQQQQKTKNKKQQNTTPPSPPPPPQMAHIILSLSFAFCRDV